MSDVEMLASIVMEEAAKERDFYRCKCERYRKALVDAQVALDGALDLVEQMYAAQGVRQAHRLIAEVLGKAGKGGA